MANADAPCSWYRHVRLLSSQRRPLLNGYKESTENPVYWFDVKQEFVFSIFSTKVLEIWERVKSRENYIYNLLMPFASLR